MKLLLSIIRDPIQAGLASGKCRSTRCISSLSSNNFSSSSFSKTKSFGALFLKHFLNPCDMRW